MCARSTERLGLRLPRRWERERHRAQLTRDGSDAEARCVRGLGMVLRSSPMQLLGLCTNAAEVDVLLEPAVRLPASELPWDGR